MKFFRALLFGALLALPLSALGQGEPAPEPKPEPAVAAPAATSDLDTNKDGKVDAKETAAATEADAGVADVIADGAEVVKAAKDLADREEGSEMPIGTMILVLLAAVFKLLLSGIKLVGKNVAWFKTKDGKRVMKYSTLGLGAAAALCANLFFGMHWIEAMQILLSGPIAVGIHEYTKDSKDTPEEAKADA
jgi:hypothetical protein